ncbi:hypothetical protein BU24DRAFT_480978 [Aaosphaeria arxii CBS 175.79]|uniref:Uncharacterized protein n=1 Tax=Aaosphaeria arxii CBS 175.79 TaxID=1450172 RepID=A0A6A5XTY2_9PLEO|nr:uncharacterized protein BU24DRAFT_480978 [Aaosphaeria arxii CBS 175.79]KAF2016376.1 hypothetical protein BU24DRAFT_480978 [Aaosphaeria arxii CBS 175.79]
MEVNENHHGYLESDVEKSHPTQTLHHDPLFSCQVAEANKEILAQRKVVLREQRLVDEYKSYNARPLEDEQGTDERVVQELIDAQARVIESQASLIGLYDTNMAAKIAQLEAALAASNERVSKKESDVMLLSQAMNEMKLRYDQAEHKKGKKVRV